MLRIITGKYKGRKICAPDRRITRPTTDRVKESIFNLLVSYLAKQQLSFCDLTVLDAFAGSGSLGFEALSRGAKHVTFFDQNPEAYSCLRYNAEKIGVDSGEVTIKRVNSTRPPKSSKAVGIVFLDPPYHKKLLKPTCEALKQAGWINSDTLIVYEHHKEEELHPFVQNNQILTNVYGDISITFLKILNN